MQKIKQHKDQILNPQSTATQCHLYLNSQIQTLDTRSQNRDRAYFHDKLLQFFSINQVWGQHLMDCEHMSEEERLSQGLHFLDLRASLQYQDLLFLDESIDIV